MFFDLREKYFFLLTQLFDTQLLVLDSILHHNEVYEVFPRLYLLHLFCIERFKVSFESPNINQNLFDELFNARDLFELLILS